MNTRILNNYSKLKLSLLFLPVFLLSAIVLFLYSHDSLSPSKYVQIQKNCFYFINSHLGQYPILESNLTQLGDASIFLSFLIIFVVYAPKIWESLLSASIISMITSYVLKSLFFVPRPSRAYPIDSFIIIGKKAVGYCSLPSGHSITTFTILTVLLLAFMPEKLKNKIGWVISVILIGLAIAFSRVGVGAHHPLDVVIGSIIGFLCGILGIFVSRKYPIWNWVNHKKYYPIFMVLILICCATLIGKISKESLIVFYLALLSLIVSLYKIIYVYVKK